uniref:Uncharacterized protein n=1 Tax=Scophthalmus maximus TaxID=52904 RepID=A0A8D3BH53_SCOMX
MRSRLPEIGAALFRSPTSSSNSEANTDDGRLMEAACSSNTKQEIVSTGADASFRCCR